MSRPMALYYEQVVGRAMALGAGGGRGRGWGRCRGRGGSREGRRTMREPHYQRIKRHLLSMIEDGRLKPGDRVPAERELNARFGVSRMTARQALIDLERGGFIIRYQGRGSFVAEPKLEE